MKFRCAFLSMVTPQHLTLAAVSLAGWTLLVTFDREMQAMSLCLSSASLAAANSAFAVAPNWPTLMAFSWFVMLLAMMPPLVAQPLAHVGLRNLARRRGLAIMLFVAGYGAAWMTAGIAVAAAAAVLGLFANGVGLPAVAGAAAVAALWQASPLRQRALNRCHRLPSLSAFGAQAHRDGVHFGLMHGVWCVATCAPLMLLPMTTPALHLPVMAALSVGLVLERLEPARHPCWRLQTFPGLAVAAMLVRSFRWSLR